MQEMVDERTWKTSLKFGAANNVGNSSAVNAASEIAAQHNPSKFCLRRSGLWSILVVDGST